MAMMLLKSRAWIGTTWSERQLQMIAGRKGMARKLLLPGPPKVINVVVVVVRFKIDLSILFVSEKNLVTR